VDGPLNHAACRVGAFPLGAAAKVDGLALTIDRRFTHHGLLLSEILTEVKAITACGSVVN